MVRVKASTDVDVTDVSVTVMMVVMVAVMATQSVTVCLSPWPGTDWAPH